MKQDNIETLRFHQKDLKRRIKAAADAIDLVIELAGNLVTAQEEAKKAGAVASLFSFDPCEQADFVLGVLYELFIIRKFAESDLDDVERAINRCQ